jgi:hypothetical protein
MEPGADNPQGRKRRYTLSAEALEQRRANAVAQRQPPKPKPPKEPKPRKPYTMSEKALEQRRANLPAAAAAATGPRTEEGKAAAGRNAWKHGRYSAIHRAHFGLGANHISKLFGKPCLTTCPFHPDNPERTEAPCSLVLDGMTHAGGPCLDKTVYVHALDSLMSAMADGNMEGMQGLLATELASNIELLRNIRQTIVEHGVVVPQYAIDKEGHVQCDSKGDPVVLDLKANPVLAHLIKFSESLQINLGEVLATPRARQKIQSDDDAADAFQKLVGAIAMRGAKKLPRTVEPADDDEG